MAGERSFKVGDTIGGRYAIEGVLGEGGMALVYRARHLGTGRACALKIIHPQLITRPALMDLFIREAQIGARVGQHPNIVDVFDAGADPERGVPFLAMELLQGETLERYAETRGPMPPALLRDLFTQLGEALDQAHRAGVVHRDLKPSNLFLVTGHKGEPLVKIVDFGIAKALENEAARTATQVGTPAYGAPEQFGAAYRQLAERQGIVITPNISPGTDVWAMGILAYELLTGLPAGQYWGADTVTELPLKVAIGQLDPASVRAGDRAALLPPGFDVWFSVCTRRNAQERWQAAGQAAAELARLLSGAPAYDRTQIGAPYTPAPPVAQIPMTPMPGTPMPGTPMAGTPMPGTPMPGYATPSPGYAPMPGAHGTAPGYAVTPAGYPPTPYGMPPAHGAPAPKKASGGGARVAIAAGAALVLLVALPLTCVGVRRAGLHAAAHACETDGTRCDEACDRDDLASCARLGRLAEVGKGVPADAKKAADLYTRACDGKEPLGCAFLEGLVLRGQGGKTADPAAAKALATTACDGGVQLGCAELGELLRDGPGAIARDEAKAAELLQAACDAGEPRGCADVGRMALDGTLGVARDEGRAASLFQKSCEGRAIAGCGYLAELYLDGRGGLAKDGSRATTLAQKSCDDGDDHSCVVLGKMYAKGAGALPKDETKAVPLFQRTCDAAWAEGCDALGDMTAGGRGGLAKDEAKAAALYRKACDGGAGDGCASIGLATESGAGGVAKSTPDAVVLYKRGCDAGSATACVYYGVNLREGDGAPKDEAQAAALFRKTCDGGAALGCTFLGNMYVDGAGGLAKDASKAVALYRRGCEGGASGACFNLGYRYEKGLDGVDKNDVTARGFYRQACDGGSSKGCLAYGIFLDQGRGGAKDPRLAAQELRVACDASLVAACAVLAGYYADGVVLPQDKAKALELYGRACDGGDTWACGKAGRGGRRR